MGGGEVIVVERRDEGGRNVKLVDFIALIASADPENMIH